MVVGFAARARELGHDSKARRLLEALRFVQDRGAQGLGSGKAVIFTESLTTQDYLRSLLLEHGYEPGDVTLFRGDNDGPDAERALEQWEAEEGHAIAPAHRPSRDVAIRLALVHEFKHRSKVFISTEAGAKGLNLQFCDTVINYDLPWNPQRIEQRIGRVHRYGQKRGVTVISFLAAGNVAQRLTLEILTQKLDLFGKVLDASDAVLYEPSHAAPESLVASVGVDFEKELRVIYGRARSIDDVTADLQHLRDTMESRRRAFDEVQERASGLIETRLDDAVRQVLASYQSSLPSELEGLDRDVDLITQAYFDGAGISYAREQQPGRVAYRVEPSASLPEGYREGFVASVGDSRNISEGEALHVGHAVVQAAIEAARQATNAPIHVVFEAGANAPDDLRGACWTSRPARGHPGVVSGHRARGQPAGDCGPGRRRRPAADAGVDGLLALPVREAGPVPICRTPRLFTTRLTRRVFSDQAAVSAQDQARFEQMLRQLDHYLADQVLIMRRKEARLNAQIEELQQRRNRTHGVQAGDATDVQDRASCCKSATSRAADRAPRGRRRRRISRVARAPVRAPVQQAGSHACAGRSVRDRGPCMLKLLHTADLHLGLESAQFEPDDRRRLARARLDVARTILSVAEQYAVDAVLWAGDIFDTPEPGEDWWRGFAKVLTESPRLEPSGRPSARQPRSHQGRTPSTIRTIPSGSCCRTGSTWSIRTRSSLP